MALFDGTVTKNSLIDHSFVKLLNNSSLTLEDIFSEITEKLYLIKSKLEQRKTNIEIELNNIQFTFLYSSMSEFLSNKLNKIKVSSDFNILSSISHKLNRSLQHNQPIILNKLEICSLLRVLEELIELKLSLRKEEALSKLSQFKFYLTNAITGYFANFIIKRSD